MFLALTFGKHRYAIGKISHYKVYCIENGQSGYITNRYQVIDHYDIICYMAP